MQKKGKNQKNAKKIIGDFNDFIKEEELSIKTSSQGVEEIGRAHV